MANKNYVDHPNMTAPDIDAEMCYRGRDVYCPYCGGLHRVPLNASDWGCRNCHKVFGVPMLFGKTGKKLE